VQQDQNIKGFTLLEIIVVVAIIAIVSAAGYPSFSKWSKDRAVRNAADKVTTMLRNINSNVQRGSYAYVQVAIYTHNLTGGPKVDFITRGLSKRGYTNLVKQKNSGAISEIHCSTSSNDWKNNGNKEINFHEKLEIGIHFSGSGSVCFSKNAAHYRLGGKLYNQPNIKVDTITSDRYIIICNRGNAVRNSNKCPTSKTTGLKSPAYLIEWTRFGQITRYRFNERLDEWARL